MTDHIQTFVKMYAGSFFRMSIFQILEVYEAWRSMDPEDYKEWIHHYEQQIIRR